MRYVDAKIEQERQSFLYRVYVTDSLQLSGQRKYITSRWADIIGGEKEDARSGDEIALEIIEKAGLVTKGGDQK